jgi:hypothetical protein
MAKVIGQPGLMMLVIARQRRDRDIVDQPELAGFHQQVEIVLAEA